MNLTMNTPAAIEANGVDVLREIEGLQADTLRVLINETGPAMHVAIAMPDAAGIVAGQTLHVEDGPSLVIEKRVARNYAAAIFRCNLIAKEEPGHAANQES